MRTEFWMFDFSPRLRGFLTAVALQRQPYLSVDYLRPTGAELRRVGRLRGYGVQGLRRNANDLRSERGVRFWGVEPAHQGRCALPVISFYWELFVSSWHLL